MAGFATLADGNTATVGTPVKVIIPHPGFRVGYIFVVEKVKGKELQEPGSTGGEKIPAGKCVAAW